MHKLICIASFRRHIASNHERMFENVFDWEHLPHLHSRTFSSISLLSKGKKTLIFEISLWPSFLRLRQKIKLQGCQRKRTWIVRVLSGFLKGLLVRSRISPERSDGFDVQVDFLVPRAKWYYLPLGLLLKPSYKRLYDEDVDMMRIRQQYLLNREEVQANQTIDSLVIGKEKDISIPYKFSLKGKVFLLNKHNEKWIAYSAYCPHLQRPFDDLDITTGSIHCPWHGYKFDLETGTSKQSLCRLPKAPSVIKDGDLLKVVFS